MRDSSPSQQAREVDDLNVKLLQLIGKALIDTHYAQVVVMHQHLCKLQTVDLTTSEELVDVNKHDCADRQC